VVICLERGADLHTAQLMPLLLTVSCFSKIQIGFTFMVPAHLGSPGQRAIKRMCFMVYFGPVNITLCSIIFIFGKRKYLKINIILILQYCANCSYKELDALVIV